MFTLKNTNSFADLQEKNVILGIEDDFILEEFERNELSNLSARKITTAISIDHEGSKHQKIRDDQ
jgi:hypothetical protein